MLYSTLVAPCMDAPTLAITLASSFISVAAVRTAIKKPGKEPLLPMAMLSPSLSPASWKYLTITAANSGFSVLLLAPSSPGVDVSSVNSGPNRPVLLISVSSIANPLSSMLFLMYASALSILAAAFLCASSYSFASVWARKRVRNMPKAKIANMDKRYAFLIFKGLCFIICHLEERVALLQLLLQKGQGLSLICPVFPCLKL